MDGVICLGHKIRHGIRQFVDNEILAGLDSPERTRGAPMAAAVAERLYADLFGRSPMDIV